MRAFLWNGGVVSAGSSGCSGFPRWKAKSREMYQVPEWPVTSLAAVTVFLNFY